MVVKITNKSWYTKANSVANNIQLLAKRE